MNKFKILFVDDEMEYRDIMKLILIENGYYVDVESSAETAIRRINSFDYDLVISDLKMGTLDGIDLLKSIKLLKETTEVIILTGYGSIESAVLAMKEGAFSYFIKSHDPDELIEEIEKIRKINEFERINRKDKKEDIREEFEYILKSNNARYTKMISIAKKAARSNSNILITGESGVGKEVIAKYIHFCSDRKKEKFIAVNCPSFSDTLLESELFGYEKGAFTGALDSRVGRFEFAKAGILFLDEIGDMSMSAQSKLLRAVETKKIERIGSNISIDVNFRLITATNCNLEENIKNLKFRSDLFYRISTVTIEIPPLRERMEDLEILTEYFVKKISIELNRSIKKVSEEIMEFLKSYNFPGNIRELKNIIERLIVLSENDILNYRDLPSYLTDGKNRNREIFIYKDEDIIQLKELRKDVEAKYIKRILELYNYNVSEAAKKLGIGKRQLFNKISEYNLRE